MDVAARYPHTMSKRIPHLYSDIKVRLSPSKGNCFICFNESSLKMMKNVFCFTMKALFVLKILKFLRWLFGHVEKTAGLER